MLIPRILIDGIGDIAPNVIWSMTEINTAAQGGASLSTLILRDFDISPYAFVTGKRVIMDFGSDETRFFGGYLWKASRRHWFPVDDPTHIQRQWRLQLVDNNILFTRRVVFKKDDPAHVSGPMYGPGRLSSPCDETAGIVYDDTAIAELVTNWLDLSVDGIDVSTLVHEVASITYGQVTEPWNAGMTFGDAMKIIAQLPAAIFYLNQWWQLIYADVDVATAPVGLSDRPAADGAQGYREMTIWDDGSQLANDALGWGAGKGVDHMVFDHERDDASVAEHGLWQDGFTLWNVWCQPTINKYVHTDLYGSPSSLRGRKDEVQSVELVTHAQGLYPGQVVRFRNHEYGVDVNIPVRTSKITFDAPGVPKYTLKLAHVLDKYGFQDPSPKFPSGGGSSGRGTPPPGLPGPTAPPPLLFKDDIAAAMTIISASGRIVQDITAFTANTGTSDPSGLSNNQSGWIKIVVPAPGTRLVLDTRGSATNGVVDADFDTMLALYSGVPGSLTLVWSNDDIGQDNTPGMFSSRVGATLDAGTYYVEVCAYSADTNWTLHFQWFMGVPSDNGITFGTTSAGASTAPGLAGSMHYSFEDPDQPDNVWVKFVLTQSVRYCFEGSGANDPGIRLYDADLTLLGQDYAWGSGIDGPDLVANDNGGRIASDEVLSTDNMMPPTIGPGTYYIELYKRSSVLVDAWLEWLLISGAVGPGIPISGPHCEMITSTGDTLTTSASYLPGSTSVRVDGIFMRPGTYAQVIAGDREYNELDPAAGTILFGTSRTRTVFVCYNVG